MPQSMIRMPPISMSNLSGKIASILRFFTKMVVINSSSVLQGTTIATTEAAHCKLEMMQVEHGPIYHFATKSLSLSKNQMDGSMEAKPSLSVAM